MQDALMSGLKLWATGTQSHRGPYETGEHNLESSQEDETFIH